MKRLLLYLSLFLNGANFFLIMIPMMILAFDGTKSYGGYGIYILVYFTVDSNLLAAAASLAVSAAALRRLRKPERPYPRCVGLFKLLGTTAVSVTMSTILFWLGPPDDFVGAFDNVSLYFHLIAPLLAIVTYIFCDRHEPLPFRYTFFSVLPTALYGTYYAVMVVYVHHWKDFYHFYAGGYWPVSAVIMLVVSYSIGLFLWGAHRLFFRLPSLRTDRGT